MNNSKKRKATEEVDEADLATAQILLEMSRTTAPNNDVETRPSAPPAPAAAPTRRSQRQHRQTAKVRANGELENEEAAKAADRVPAVRTSRTKKRKISDADAQPSSSQPSGSSQEQVQSGLDLQERGSPKLPVWETHQERELRLDYERFRERLAVQYARRDLAARRAEEVAVLGNSKRRRSFDEYVEGEVSSSPTERAKRRKSSL